ncbi:MAG TPA: hypothetical protein VF239_09510 [Vicinamibacterales bacterium]
MRGPQHERLEEIIGRWQTQGKMTAGVDWEPWMEVTLRRTS